MTVRLKTHSLVDSLRDALQEAILRGEIPAGSQLTEQAVADKYGIARPTAKAALEQLVHAGIMRRSLNRAARVPLLDADDVRDLYFNRGLVERGVVTALAQRRIEVPGARRAVDELRRASDVAEIVEADIRFHRALVAALGSPRATRLHESVIGEAHLCMAQVQVHHLLDPEVIASEHAGILEAVTAGSSRKAAELMDDHLVRARDQLVAYLDS